MEMKSLSEIAVGLITHIHDTLPEVDTKEGTFIRDVFIDPVATQIADLFQELKLLELGFSIITATDKELDRLARNFFITRKDATYATGKLRFYLGTGEPTEDIFIPKGSLVGTESNENEESKEYSLSSAIYVVAGDPGTYQYDASVNKWFVDVDASSAERGLDYNTDINTITLLGDVVQYPVESVTNPYPFTGGSDAESDVSLQMRISMAITGVNIGTKDGYKSFMLQQGEVEDAIVVGAGDPLMTRDNREGGMVDIYIRAENAEEDDFTFDVDYSYVRDTGLSPSYKNIVLRKQPALIVNNIIGKRPNANSETGFDDITYINGSNYNKEKGSDRYYRDIKWGFVVQSIDDLFDEDLLKAEANNELNRILRSVSYLQDIKYNIEWQLINPSNDQYVPEDPNFYRGYYGDGLIYMVKTRNRVNNPYFGGRNFIMKDGEVYERIYVEPDFEVEYDKSDNAKSVMAKDSIKWISNSARDNLPKEGETLYISYSWNGVMQTLQDRLDQKRILTADVLLKQATEIPIEIKMEVVLAEGYHATSVRNEVISNISSYVNDTSTLGGEIDQSDLVYLARGSEGVEAVNIKNVHLSIYDNISRTKIELSDREYMKLKSIYIKVLDAGTTFD